MLSKFPVQSSDPQLFQSLNGLRQLAETRRFKAWFLDQFGVLHDGKQPYPGAISTLEKLATTGAKMVIISNSSRRASVTMEKIKGLGFDPSLFAGAITSGELTHQYLQRRDDAWFAALGRSCIHMTWSDRGAISLEGLGLQVVENVEEAEFILAHGTEALGHPTGAACPMDLEDLEKILEQCACKKIPMVVANPDYVTVEARALRVMPGALASKYEKLGGEVRWMGKPDKIIYKAAIDMVGVEPCDSIAVGDSIHHDIKGANVAGIQSAFITGGIHATELGLSSFGEVADLSSVQTLASKYDAYPSHYCWKGFVRGFGRLSLMGAVVVAVFAAAYGPFIYHGQIQQVIRRMFPFGRGLCHAYWAPNFWVFYIILDKVLSFILRRLGFDIQIPAASFTGGLVGDSSPFAILPRVTPATTFIVVLLALSPCLIKAWRNPRPGLIARWIAYAYMCGFLFGWHVHEKAALHFVIPLAIVAVQSLEDAKHYFMLSIVSCYSLFPLLYEAQEYPIKVMLLILHTILMWLGFYALFNEKSVTEAANKKKGTQLEVKGSCERGRFVMGWVGKSYLYGLLIVEIWGQFLHPYFLGDKLPFVPLMSISIYCALGIMYSWIWQLSQIVQST